MDIKIEETFLAKLTVLGETDLSYILHNKTRFYSGKTIFTWCSSLDGIKMFLTCGLWFIYIVPYPAIECLVAINYLCNEEVHNANKRGISPIQQCEIYLLLDNRQLSLMQHRIQLFYLWTGRQILREGLPKRPRK